MRANVLLVLLGMQFFACCIAFGQTDTHESAPKIDIDSVMKGFLDKHDLVPVTRQITVNVPYKDCYRAATRSGALGPEVCNNKTAVVQQPQTTQEHLTLTSLQFVASQIRFGALTQTALPDRIVAASEEICNPTPATGTQNASLSQQVQHTQSVTLTHTVTTSVSSTISATTKLSDSLSLTDSITVGLQDAEGKAELNGSALTQTLQVQVTEQVPAQSRYALEFLVTPTRFSVPFTLTMTVDGKLSQNDLGLAMVSQVVDEKDRTFSIEGTASAELGLSARYVFKQLDWDPQVCPGPGITAKPLSIKPNQKMTQLKKDQS